MAKMIRIILVSTLSNEKRYYTHVGTIPFAEFAVLHENRKTRTPAHFSGQVSWQFQPFGYRYLPSGEVWHEELDELVPNKEALFEDEHGQEVMPLGLCESHPDEHCLGGEVLGCGDGSDESDGFYAGATMGGG